ncbi:MAG: hypothetical protein HY886_03335 [Deltaproteobacteria bacterium]|nr:hypothetical protein [Deltaproteobacteria bacterium]
METIGQDYIEVEAYLSEMLKALDRHGLGPDNLCFVDDFPNAPNAVSRVGKIEKKITFRRRITKEDKALAIEALKEKFASDVKALDDDWAFVKHSLLHKVCGIIYRYQNDYECIKWAFYQLRF